MMFDIDFITKLCLYEYVYVFLYLIVINREVLISKLQEKVVTKVISVFARQRKNIVTIA